MDKVLKEIKVDRESGAKKEQQVQMVLREQQVDKDYRALKVHKVE